MERLEAKNFDTRAEMLAWEEELVGRIRAQVGDLPGYIAESVFISEHGCEWAEAAEELLQYAFASGMTVDADLVKPALAFWGPRFFSYRNALLFAGRWLSPKQIEGVFTFRLMPAPASVPESEKDNMEKFTMFPNPEIPEVSDKVPGESISAVSS